MKRMTIEQRIAAAVAEARRESRATIDRLIGERDAARSQVEHVRRETARQVAAEAHRLGYEDGYRNGAFDALCQVAPDHAKALSFRPRD